MSDMMSSTTDSVHKHSVKLDVGHDRRRAQLVSPPIVGRAGAVGGKVDSQQGPAHDPHRQQQAKAPQEALQIIIMSHLFPKLPKGNCCFCAIQSENDHTATICSYKMIPHKS